MELLQQIDRVLILVLVVPLQLRVVGAISLHILELANLQALEVVVGEATLILPVAHLVHLVLLLRLLL